MIKKVILLLLIFTISFNIIAMPVKAETYSSFDKFKNDWQNWLDNHVSTGYFKTHDWIIDPSGLSQATLDTIYENKLFYGHNVVHVENALYNRRIFHFWLTSKPVTVVDTGFINNKIWIEFSQPTDIFVPRLGFLQNVTRVEYAHLSMPTHGYHSTSDSVYNQLFQIPPHPMVGVMEDMSLLHQMNLLLDGIVPFLILLIIVSVAFYLAWQLLLRLLRKA